MASAFSHAFVAIALGKAYSLHPMPWRFWVLSVLCAVLPDADVIGFALGVKYGDLLGHRGLSHSLSVAFVLGVRCKAPGAFGTAATVPGLRPLRAAFQVGRGEDILGGVLTGVVRPPRVAPGAPPGAERPAEAASCDLLPTIPQDRKQAASYALFAPMHPCHRHGAAPRWHGGKTAAMSGRVTASTGKGNNCTR